MRVSTITFFTVVIMDEDSLSLENVPKLSAFLEDLCSQECCASKDIVLDFDDVFDISSSGVGLLVHMHRIVTKQYRNNLYFININEKIEKIFELTKLKDFFKIYKDYEELTRCLEVKY
jgi:anti-anti-sigma factor